MCDISAGFSELSLGSGPEGFADRNSGSSEAWYRARFGTERSRVSVRHSWHEPHTFLVQDLSVDLEIDQFSEPSTLCCGVSHRMRSMQAKVNEPMHPLRAICRLTGLIAARGDNGYS
jgi:hypothetical protein